MALVQVFTAAVVLALVVVVTVTAPAPLVVYAFPLVGVECVLVGVLTWDRRPSNGTGALLCGLGFSIIVAAAGNTFPPAFVTVGTIAAELPIAVLLHLMLAFPGGRLPDVRHRLLATAGYAFSVVPAFATVLVAGVYPATGPDAGFAAAADRWQSGGGGAVIVLSAVVLLRRARRARVATGERRALATVFVYGWAVVVFMPLSAQILTPLLELGPLTLFGLQLASMAGFPLVMAAAVFAGGFARTGEIQELATWLAGRDTDRPPLRDALAHVLGDPSLELLFHASAGEGLLDPHGRRVEAPRGDGGRGVVVIDGRDGPLAVVVHDRTLIADQALVASAGRMVALALERERLTAELLAGREVIRTSRARILEVGDLERRRLAQDLHDLLQGRLVLAAVHAGRMAAGASDEATRESALALSRELDAAVTQLRRQLHDVMPAPLIERGLLVALEDLADRVPLLVRLDLPADPLPLPPTVASTAYFIVAEAVANTVKHAGATELVLGVRRDGPRLRIEVADDGAGGDLRPGTGMRSMATRAEALDGSLEVSSTPSGTGVVAWLPCAW